MTVNFRTTTSFFSEKAKSTMSDTQSKIFNLSRQIESGKYANSYQDFADKLSIDNYLSLKDTKSILDAKIRNNSVLESKLDEIERIVRHIADNIIVESAKLCVEMNNPAIANTLPSATLAKSQLAKIEGLLNSGFNGQKLFAGSKTDIQNVVGDIVNINNITAGVINANYYNGDQEIMTESISGTQKLAYGIIAGDPAFQKLIAAHHYMIAGNGGLAMDTLQQAKAEIADLLTEFGSNYKSVTNQIEIDENSVLALGENISEIEDVDVTLLMPQMMALQVQMKASFMLTSQLANLSLVNYLK